MKRNLLGFAAIVLAIAISSFSVKKTTYFYYVYDGSGDQTSTTNYSSQSSQPSHLSGTNILNWFRVTDVDDNGVDGTEFIDSFESYDVVNDDLNTLNDDSDITGQLDRKS